MRGVSSEGAMSKPRNGIDVDAEVRAVRCFRTANEARAWAETTNKDGRVSPCIDCSEGYRDQMVLEARCAHPETVFIRDDSGTIVGVNCHDPRWQYVVAGRDSRNNRELAYRMRLVDGGTPFK